MKIDIHNYSHKLDKGIERLKTDPRVTKKNQDYVLAFLDQLIADGISKPRVAKYVDVLKYWAVWLNMDFDKATREDIAPIVTKIQLNENYSPWTKQVYKVMIKRFIKWKEK